MDVNIFRHEFITIFRFAESATLHPADFQVVEPIDDALVRYEEENDTVFLAKGLMERLRKLTADPRKSRIPPQPSRPSPSSYYASQRHRQR
jgi:hypothetical protein